MSSTPGAEKGAMQPSGTPAGTPANDEAAKAEATKAATTCKKIIGELGKKASALKGLPEQKRADLLRPVYAQRAITCLAVANADHSYCDLLAGDAKSKCVDQYARVREIKAMPKGQVKAHVIHELCSRDSPKADCDIVQEAMNAGDAAKCAGISQPPLRDFCAALATGDAAKCKGVPAGDQRSYCEAYASEDASRCPKDSVDCQNLANNFAAFRKKGLAGVQGVDPSAAAGVKGRAACTPLLADLEKRCRGEQ